MRLKADPGSAVTAWLSLAWRGSTPQCPCDLRGLDLGDPAPHALAAAKVPDALTLGKALPALGSFPDWSTPNLERMFTLE